MDSHLDRFRVRFRRNSRASHFLTPLLRRIAGVSALGLSLACGIGSLSSEPVHAAGPSDRGALAALHQAIGADDARKAHELVDRVLRDGTPSEQEEAKLLAGRVWLMEENLPAFRDYGARMRQGPLDENAEQLLAAYDAWALALSGEPDAARTALDALLGSSKELPATAEIAEILATVHLIRGDAEGVKNAAAFGLKFIEYHGGSPPFLAVLLRNRLDQAADIGKDPAESLFRQAERARQTRKWSSAYATYDRVQREYPTSELRHPAQFWQAVCLHSDGRMRQAVDMWRAFIDESPNGPWRGQAHVALADAFLEDAGDIALATKEVALARAAAHQQIEPPAQASWGRARVELDMRLGLIALLENRHDAAAEAFQTAGRAIRESGIGQRDGFDEQGVSRLLVLSQRKIPLVPADVVLKDAGGTTRLLLGSAYEVAGRREKVRTLLGPIALGKNRPPSKAAQSYARFVLARAEESQGHRSDSVNGYRQSVQIFPGGSWHDETLHRQANLIEELAAESSSKRASGKASKPAADHPSTVASRETARREKSVQATARVRALGEALPVWEELIKRYPTSRRVQPALFHASTIAVAIGQPAEAVDYLTQLLSKEPEGPYAGQCHSELVVLRLEHLFDLAGAAADSKAALAWYSKRNPGGALGEVVATSVKLPSDGPVDPLLRSDRDLGYDLNLHAGLVAYLDGRRPEALDYFRQAASLAVPPQSPTLSDEAPMTAVDRLMKAAEADRDLVPAEVLEGDPRAKVCLQLAACYYSAAEFSRTLELTERAIETIPSIKPQQRAWARFLHGRAYHALWQPLDALDDFSAALAEAPGASWAPQCQFFVANSTFTYAKEIPAAIALWAQLVKRYPDSEFTDRAAYHIGFAYQAAGQYKQARDAYDAFVKKYPTSPFVRPIQKYHLHEIQAAISAPTP